MTAIAGFLSFGGEPARDPCARMLRGLESYGSHSTIFTRHDYACGRRLYKTLPEDDFDQQPLRRGPYQLVADVRLDNRAQLASALALTGAHAAKLADSDLLFECLIKWGENAAEKLVGEFAFAFWNEAEGLLLLGRDLFGFRPLHYHCNADFFAFASMPSGLHALPRVPRGFDPDAMAEELGLLGVLGSRTHFRGIDKVRAGHLLRVTIGARSTASYWRAPQPDSRSRTPQDYEEELRGLVDLAVGAQLRGAGRVVGSHLSAGLDSSIVTATAARQFRPDKVIAFTAAPRNGFQGPVPDGTLSDESKVAAETAELYDNIDHVIVRGSEESLTEVMDRQAQFMQQPTSGVCNSLWSRQISRAAKKRGIRVMLVGFTGNMTASYSGREAWSALLVRGRLVKLSLMAARMIGNGTSPRTLAAQLFGPILPRRLWRAACRLYGRPTDLEEYTAISLCQIEALRRRGAQHGLDLLFQPTNDALGHRLHALFDCDNGNYFKGMLGEFGLSFRDPLSDKRVVEFCLRVPAEEFIRDGHERALARRAFGDRLPSSVSQLYERGYQGADWYESLARDMPSLRKEMEIIGRCSQATDVLDMNWLKQAISSWPNGDWSRRDVILRYRYGLLRGLSAGHFMRKVAGTN